VKADRRILENAPLLSGKTVAVTGTTGGLGKELCRYLAKLGAELILLDRSLERSRAFADDLSREFGSLKVRCMTVDLSDFSSVRQVTELLKQEKLDLFIHNAGAYSIPRRKCDTGFDNVFQINFVSPYYMIRELLPTLRAAGGRVVVVGSIAHRYSKSAADDIDFSSRKQASKVYGNAKRYLMFSLFELFRREDRVILSVTHPGISFTNITAHYPKLIFAVIKHPMKIIFMKPKKAALSILQGVIEPCGDREWIGPWLFDIWGMPKKKNLHSCKTEEMERIGRTAEEIYQKLHEDSVK